MKIIIAPDKFKGSLTCFEVCNAINEGINTADKSIETFCFPMADGGDGFAIVMQYYLNTETVHCSTKDPLGRIIKASYQWHKEKKTAIIEMAVASGLVLVNKEERNLLKASSYGTGLLIKDAIKKGAKNIYLGLGGSATNDGGIGILAALGFQFTDKAGNILEPCGESLNLIENIITPPINKDINFEIACDVQNPLFGPEGAAYIYSPQKGASADQVQMLDDGLKNYAKILKQHTGIDVANIPGTGAAGGVAASLIPFFKVTLKSGIDMIIDLSGIKSKITEADLLITGEGKIDLQTLQGKVIKNLVMLATQNKIPTIAFCGVIEDEAMLLSELKLKAVESIASSTISIEEAISNAKQLLTNKVENYFKLNQVI